MSSEKVGVWLVGAWGGVATTVVTGLCALKRGLTRETALVSALPQFQFLKLADWSQFVVGGHEIRDTTYSQEAEKLYRLSRVFDRDLLDQIQPDFAEMDARVRPGTLLNVGPTIASFASETVKRTENESPQAAVARLRQDLELFRSENQLGHVVVVNVSSTEPPLSSLPTDLSWNDLRRQIEESSASPVPASTLYAIAAMQSGCSYVNFTPSIGSDLPALEQLALETGTLHVGRDGKTGETLMKSVLAPMFAARNLHVMSWVGHNIFGNMDGKVLDDPINKANKVRSKDHLLTEILGYKPQTLVSIEYIESMADWKTAWDHIHFEGFLDTKMTLQFTWQGCDSLLAAPLVLDLVRLTEREARRGQCGIMTHLSSFFKSPMGTDVPEFHKQYTLLEQWAETVAAETRES